MRHKDENVKLFIFQHNSNVVKWARQEIKKIIITQNSEPMRKQKLDEKRCLHLLGVGQLDYLHETKKISKNNVKVIHLTIPKKY